MNSPLHRRPSAPPPRWAWGLAAMRSRRPALWNRPLLQSLSWNMTYSTGLAFEPVVLERKPYGNA